MLNNDIKNAVTRQYRSQVNQAYHASSSLSKTPPSEGWVRTVRKALGMSLVQAAERLGVTKARISKLELSEPDGSVTLKSMHSAAEAMNCRFVYAVVPNTEIEELIQHQATLKAKEIIRKASTHMALEAQALSHEKVEAQVESLAREFMETPPVFLWDRT